MLVIGSGKEPSAVGTASVTPGAKKVPTTLANTKTFSFKWDKPSFPGTIIAGTFQEYKTEDAGLDLHVFFKLRPDKQDLSADYASTAVKAFTFLRYTIWQCAVDSTEDRGDSRRHRAFGVGA